MSLYALCPSRTDTMPHSTHGSLLNCCKKFFLSVQIYLCLFYSILNIVRAFSIYYKFTSLVLNFPPNLMFANIPNSTFICSVYFFQSPSLPFTFCSSSFYICSKSVTLFLNISLNLLFSVITAISSANVKIMIIRSILYSI